MAHQLVEAAEDVAGDGGERRQKIVDRRDGLLDLDFDDQRPLARQPALLADEDGQRRRERDERGRADREPDPLEDLSSLAPQGAGVVIVRLDARVVDALEAPRAGPLDVVAERFVGPEAVKRHVEAGLGPHVVGVGLEDEGDGRRARVVSLW